MSLKWIKASERLPEKWGMYYVKIGPLEDKTCWTRGKIIERFNEGLDKIEWLSEDSKEDEREDCEGGGIIIKPASEQPSEPVVSLPCTDGNSIELIAKLITKHFPSDVLSDQMGEDYDELKSLLYG